LVEREGQQSSQSEPSQDDDSIASPILPISYAPLGSRLERGDSLLVKSVYPASLSALFIFSFLRERPSTLTITPTQKLPTLSMVRLREIPRTATFAWSPGAASPLIATGTRAGAVDADFSNETCLELWDLGLSNQVAGAELQPVAKVDTDSGCVHTIICLPVAYG
jgi:hypothetical protein